MDTKIILIYCICSDFLKRTNHISHDAQRMSDDEVLTIAIVSAMFFFGNHERARIFLKEYGYIPNMLSKSQLNGRLHAFDDLSFATNFFFFNGRSNSIFCQAPPLCEQRYLLIFQDILKIKAITGTIGLKL